MHVFLCAPGFEDALRREIGPRAVRAAPGIVFDPDSPPLARADHVFARQVLPDAVRLRGASIGALADAALGEILRRLEPGGRPFALQAILSDAPADPHRPGELARRLALLEEALWQRLKERRRRLLRRRLPALAPGATLVQLLLFGREEAFLSAAAPTRLAGEAEWPVPFPAGRAEVADDFFAPASAFRKLEEALAWLGVPMSAEERCVDLGAAPGSWSHVALARGARVTAVDRAALDPRLGRHPRLEQVRRDGFAYVPPDPPVDWLLCDIIAAPAKTLDLVDRWLAGGWCRRLVVHLKFKGRADYGLCEAARARLRQAGLRRHRVKHLFYDRNEVTLVGA